MNDSDWAADRWQDRTRCLLRRTRELDLASLGLLTRTFCLLLAAKIALQVIPVGQIIAWKQRPLAPRPLAPRPILTHAQALEINNTVRWAVLVVARYSPFEFVCFPTCLAASALLRGQGIESRLHYGVTRLDRKLATHTWLEASGETVIGGEVAAHYSTLAVY